jgi:hypothetical protein
MGNIENLNWSSIDTYQVIIACLIVVISYLFIYINKIDVETIQIEKIESELILEEEKYLRFVYIGSSGCVYSNNEITHQILRELKEYFRTFAHEQGYRFLSRAIAVDPSSDRGFYFLIKSGPYDEIISGSRWFNLGVYRYIWDTLPGYASTPQILLTVTEYKPTLVGNHIGYINQEEKLLKRISGLSEIQELLDDMKRLTTKEISDRIGLVSHL